MARELLCFSPYIFPSPPPCIVPSSALLPLFPGFLCVPPLTSGALEAGGFTTPCSPVQTRCRPPCVEGSPEVVVMSTVFSVGLWGRCAVSWPLGSGREQGGTASLGGRQEWPCSELSPQKPGKAAVSHRAECGGTGVSYTGLCGPKPPLLSTLAPRDPTPVNFDAILVLHGCKCVNCEWGWESSWLLTENKFLPSWQNMSSE